MAKSILEVRGIGPATAELLAKHGFKTEEDLAAGKIENLAAVKGFNTIRAGQVINDAKALFAELASEAPKVKKNTKIICEIGQKAETG